jgi:hypothetical protein
LDLVRGHLPGLARRVCRASAGSGSYEAAAGDLLAYLGLGPEFEFVARRGFVRVLARAKASTRRHLVVTNGVNQRGDSGSHCGVVAADSPPLPAVTTVTNAPAAQYEDTWLIQAMQPELRPCPQMVTNAVPSSAQECHFETPLLVSIS